MTHSHHDHKRDNVKNTVRIGLQKPINLIVRANSFPVRENLKSITEFCHIKQTDKLIGCLGSDFRSNNQYRKLVLLILGYIVEKNSTPIFMILKISLT